MPMHIDETRHQRAPAAVDQDGVSALINRDRRRRDTLDSIPADKDVRWFRELTALAVEDPNVLEHRRSRRWRLRIEWECEPTQ